MKEKPNMRQRAILEWEIYEDIGEAGDGAARGIRCRSPQFICAATLRTSPLHAADHAAGTVRNTQGRLLS